MAGPKFNDEAIAALAGVYVERALIIARTNVQRGKVSPADMMTGKNAEQADEDDRRPYETWDEVPFLHRVDLVKAELFDIVWPLVYGRVTDSAGDAVNRLTGEASLRYLIGLGEETAIVPANEYQRACVTLFADAMVAAVRKAKAGYYFNFEIDGTGSAGRLSDIEPDRRVDAIVAELVRMVEAVKGGMGEQPTAIADNVRFAYRYVRLKGGTL